MELKWQLRISKILFYSWDPRPLDLQSSQIAKKKKNNLFTIPTYTPILDSFLIAKCESHLKKYPSTSTGNQWVLEGLRGTEALASPEVFARVRMSRKDANPGTHSQLSGPECVWMCLWELGRPVNSCTKTDIVKRLYYISEIDECATNPCLNNGTCVDLFNNYYCNCPAGYNGSHCETGTSELHSIS